MALRFWPRKLKPAAQPIKAVAEPQPAAVSSVSKPRVLERATPAKYILIANSKGGSGKSTLAINLASVYANMGFNTSLIDYDSQGSSTEWLNSRSHDHSHINGVIAHRDQPGYMRSWTLSIPRDCQRVIIDTPAKLGGFELSRMIQSAHIILVPVLPSPIDISASAEFIGDILLSSEFNSGGNRKQIAVIPNRVRPNTLIYQKLHRFLESLQLPLLDPLRDTDIYLRSFESGIGAHEMTEALVEQQQWEAICNWLEATLAWQTGGNEKAGEANGSGAVQSQRRGPAQTVSRTRRTARQATGQPWRAPHLERLNSLRTPPPKPTPQAHPVGAQSEASNPSPPCALPKTTPTNARDSRQDAQKSTPAKNGEGTPDMLGAAWKTPPNKSDRKAATSPRT